MYALSLSQVLRQVPLAKRFTLHMQRNFGAGLLSISSRGWPPRYFWERKPGLRRLISRSGTPIQ
jgi:hypothetical protein